jgi:transcriptional regulator with XRE-family HTH domain
MFVKRLKILRVEKGLPQTQLAALLGFSVQRYNHYETGRREPDNQTLRMIAEFFGVSADYLLGMTESRKQYPG